MDLALLIVGPQVFNVPSSWYYTSVRLLELVCSESYYSLNDVQPFPTWPENSRVGISCIGVDFPKD